MTVEASERRTQKSLQALGLCAKAGKLIAGTPLICEALKGRKKPYLVVEAADNANNTAKRLEDRCAFYGVEKLRLGVSGETLALALGRKARIAAVAVTDEHLSRLVRGTMAEQGS